MSIHTKNVTGITGQTSFFFRKYKGQIVAELFDIIAQSSFFHVVHRLVLYSETEVEAPHSQIPGPEAILANKLYYTYHSYLIL